MQKQTFEIKWNLMQQMKSNSFEEKMMKTRKAAK